MNHQKLSRGLRAFVIQILPRTGFSWHLLVPLLAPDNVFPPNVEQRSHVRIATPKSQISNGLYYVTAFVGPMTMKK
jgi:hypothetical protein